MMRRYRHKGFILLSLLSLIIIVISVSIIAAASLNKQKNLVQTRHAHSLSIAKDALLGFALLQTPVGKLPCPDTTADGYSDVSGSSCDAQRGRLPYKTLGLDGIKGVSTEALWYALDLTYSNVSNTANFNSSTTSQLVLNGSDSIVAIILAPGSSLSGQNRASSNVSNYLEGVNADADLNTYERNPSLNNNDEVLVIPTSSFWTTMEAYALVELKKSLLSYYNTPGCNEFPWASNSSPPYDSQLTLEVGTLPIGAAFGPNQSPSCPGSLNIPSWLVTHWENQFQYATCSSVGSNCLDITGDRPAFVNTLLASPGSALSSQVRPSSNKANYYEGVNSNTLKQFEQRNVNNLGGTFNDTLIVVAP